MGLSDQAATLPLDTLKAHPQTAALQAAARHQLHGTDVAKIKVYALNGRTVFSTEAAQIGDSKAGNAGFQAARAGPTATELTHRDKFSAFDQVVENRNLLSAYVPLRDALTAQVRVVFELHSDVTPLVQEINRAQTWVTAVVVAVLGLLYALLLGVVRVADRANRRQHDELQLASQQVAAARDELELRVQERTAQLEHSKTSLSAAWNTAQRAHQQRCDALSGISGEIRAPIHVVINAFRSLSATPLDADQRRHVERIRGAAAALSGVLVERLEPAMAQSARVRIEVPESVPAALSESA